MKRIAFILLVIMMACNNGMVCTSVCAQNEIKPMAYSGHIAGVEGETIEYATVILLQEERQKAGAVTDNLGDFTMEVKRIKKNTIERSSESERKRLNNK